MDPSNHDLIQNTNDESLSVEITKRLLVDGKPVPMSNDTVRLYLSRIGEGVFDIRDSGDWQHRPLVEMYASLLTNQEYLMFTGAAVKTERMGPGSARVHCMELSVAMQLPLVINRVQITAREVVALVEAKTGLRFLLPTGATFLDERRVNYQHSGTCAEALDSIGKRWGLKEVVWYQLPDGRMYFGHWTQGPFTAAPLPLEPRLISELNEKKRTLVLPYIPALRPGMLVEADFSFRIDALSFSGEKLQVHYQKVS